MTRAPDRLRPGAPVSKAFKSGQHLYIWNPGRTPGSQKSAMAPPGHPAMAFQKRNPRSMPGNLIGMEISEHKPRPYGGHTLVARYRVEPLTELLDSGSWAIRFVNS